MTEIEGAADPVGATEIILARMLAPAARVVYPSEIVGPDQPNGRLRAVKTTQGDVQADVLVVACGTDTPRVATMAGLAVQLTRSPGILFAYAAAAQSRRSHRVVADRQREAEAGRPASLTGLDFGSSPTEDATMEKGERLVAKMAAVVPKLANAVDREGDARISPAAERRISIVGFAEGCRPDVYVTVMH